MSKTEFGKGCHLHLIDGSAFIFRAYHALPPLTRKSDGLPIGAVSGFCNMLQRYVEGNHGPDAPTHVAVIFDKGSHTFRNDMYDLYKANREAMPEDLRPQMPLTREATHAFNIACEEKEGYEADDIIATLAVQARAAGGRCTIISSDKDLMQLVGDGVEMYDAMKNKRIDRDGVFEKFGVFPERVVDVQALAGDSVDNVPGAPGIGIKTAALLINEYGDLESLLDRAEEIKQPKRRQTLVDKRDQIELSKRLVQLDEKTPLDFTLEDLEVRDPDPDKLLAFLAEMEFRTLTKRIADQLGAEAPTITDKVAPEAEAVTVEDIPFDATKYECVRDAVALLKWVDQIREHGWVAVDTETTGLNEMIVDLVGISLCVRAGTACYIPLTHRDGSADDLFGSDELAEGQMPLNEALDILKPVLEDPAILKIGQNMKYDSKIFKRYGVSVAPIDDTMLMSSAMHAGEHGHGMDTLSDRYLNHTPIPIKPLLGSGKSAITFDKVPIDEATAYAAEDADITLRLWQHFKPQLHRAQVTTVYETLERPLVPVLAEMEMHGIKVDREVLSRMSNAFAQKMAGLEAEIHELSGETFNVGSPAQLGEILFEKMGLEGGKKGKTGKYSTGADILEDLATEHELPRRVLDWRQLSKLKSTYTDALQTHINPDTGRVHTSYSITGATTGRLASTDPNLQNIPVRTEEGRRIREAFIPEPGNVLLSLDYSQIELRILAHIAGIDALKQAFADGLDIHAMTASEMFDVPLDEMTSDIRRQAKAINFGVIYGISGFGLARNLRIPRSEAQGFIDRYFERFPGIRTYMDDTVAFAKEHGYVQTLFGRKIHTPEMSSKGPRAGFAKRAAINAPIQGTAADVIRRAMIQMPAAIAHLPARMLLQVHDELLFEVPADHVDETIDVARCVMEGASDPAVKLDVKLTVDAGQGANWAEAH
ncbi:DNA polymerase I [Phaeobacter gallaeciensis]|uniref:DNA polymerase I n=2 Tax=Roseobacteraceae TaxID=2854170 RepID=A0A366X1A4_9RHOB|nr:MULTISPECIES: DNA polymerase I [Roseobacteraceae]MBT3141198.1 DNA polymerase I [Falsiruegeria litorea]MBT8170803.1 DNA polymerase I [Falsiruegeria litorea]RBW54483.1 DNA polymerase I [Phaeobacter gallaeciensis]